MTDSRTVIIPDELRALNRQRCDRWHPPGDGDDWTLGDWGNALAGEVGELCNVVKKLRRHQSGASQAYNTPPLQALQDHLMVEVADVLLYLDLLCWKAGVEPKLLREVVRAKFNTVSEAQGWDDLRWESE